MYKEFDILCRESIKFFRFLNHFESNVSIKRNSKERTHYCVGWTNEEVIRFKFKDIRTLKGSVCVRLNWITDFVMVLPVRLDLLSLFLRMQRQTFLQGPSTKEAIWHK